MDGLEEMEKLKGDFFEVAGKSEVESRRKRESEEAQKKERIRRRSSEE